MHITRRSVATLLTTLVLLTQAACADDPRSLAGRDGGDAGDTLDAGPTETDGSSRDAQASGDGGSSDVDAGPDGGGATCAEIQTCVNACEARTGPCPDGCVRMGTEEAQGGFLALTNCFNREAAASCADRCPTPSAPHCLVCVAAACETEYLACFGGEPPTPGFSRECTPGTCPDGLTCVLARGQPTGYCAKQCTELSRPCDGSPLGTLSYCLDVGDPSGTSMPLCIFACETPGRSIPCPIGMSCTIEEPPDSGQMFCTRD